MLYYMKQAKIESGVVGVLGNFAQVVSRLPLSLLFWLGADCCFSLLFQRRMGVGCCFSLFFL